MKILKYLSSILPLITVILTVSLYLLSNDLSHIGYEVSSIEDQINLYREENEILRQQMSSLDSIYNLSELATEMGFVYPQKIENISDFADVALR